MNSKNSQQQSRQQLEEVFQQRYSSLNPAQQEAVNTIEGPVLVVAGPGSGKTELLSLRVANILRQTDTLASSILCLTFTDSAAANMQKRLETLIGVEAYRVAIHTFHSFGREIISQNPEYFYKGANYAPADEITQLRILQEIFENLPHTNIFTSFHPEQGFTYIKEAKSRISELKRNGISPEDYRRLLQENKVFLEKATPLIAEVFDARIDASIYLKIDNLLAKLTLAIPESERKTAKANGIKSLAKEIIDSLTVALNEAQSSEKPSTKPITAWKQKYLKKNDSKETILKDADRLQKNFDLTDTYEKYLHELHKQGLFDYDDMLLDVVKALTNKPDLRYTLQEKYLYVLVDEFQDTNGVQMNFLDLLLDAELHEGRPNIMAVGDDDQAIYKFQGANIENILGFHQKFRDPKLIVLTANYRSNQTILDFARNVILQGEDRLENRLVGQIEKKLVAGRTNLPIGLLKEETFNTWFEEQFWVAQKIKSILESGSCKASDIALLSPVHRILEQTAQVLNYFGIPVAYERQKNLLEDRFIGEILTILTFIDTDDSTDEITSDHLLPTILSYEFWGLSRIAIWQLSLQAARSRPKKTWLEVMHQSESKYIKSIGDFFINLRSLAKECTAEEIIDLITGVEVLTLGMDEYGDEVDQGSLPLNTSEKFVSPFKNFYFSREEFTQNQSRYLEYLKNLSAFIEKIRHYSEGKTLYVHDIIEFIELLHKNNLPLNHTMDFSTQDDAVQLMTVHKAKGMEFDTVFVLHCQDEAWVTRRGERLQFPSNVPLSPESQTDDDHLRKFFVAITRAKNHLYLTHHLYDDKGREQSRLRFMPHNDDVKIDESISQPEVDIEALKQNFAEKHGAQKFFELPSDIRRHEFTVEEQHMLKKIVENYRLSVTHLINFLDVVDGGPQYFLEQNLLRFPQMIGVSAAFGSAMHEALYCFYKEYQNTHQLPTLEYLKDQFAHCLEKQRLNRKNYQKQLVKGLDYLGVYYEKRHALVNPRDRVEADFSTQQIVINGAVINGKIDRLHFDQDSRQLEVIDYKTGKPFTNWEESSAVRKAWKYRMQLIFYKLLVENSREFKGKYQVQKGLLEFLEPKNNEILTLDLVISKEEVERLVKLIGIVYAKIRALDFPDVSSYEKDVYGVDCFIQDLLEGKA